MSYERALEELKAKNAFAADFAYDADALKYGLETWHHILAYAMNGQFLGVMAVDLQPGLYGLVATVPHVYIAKTERDGVVFLKLVEAMEAWVKEHGATRIFANMRYTEKTQIFEKHGYQAVGVSLFKEV